MSFTSRPWYPGPGPRLIRLIEPILKVILPPLAVSVELYFDHPDGFRYLRCPEGTVFAGRFAMSHANNWQHAATYPPVVLSGLVDLLSTRVPLPQGTGHAFLALAFFVQAFVMGTHQKHQSQDAMVHWLLFITMCMCFIAVLLELHAPRSPLAALTRGATALFQGAWMVQIAKIEFEHRPEWSEEYGGGAMMAPVYFVTIAVLCMGAIVVFGLVMGGAHRLGWVLPPPPPPPVIDEDVSSMGRRGQYLPVYHHPPTHDHEGHVNRRAHDGCSGGDGGGKVYSGGLPREESFENDSARCSSENDGGSSPTHLQAPPLHVASTPNPAGPARSPFNIG